MEISFPESSLNFFVKRREEEKGEIETLVRIQANSFGAAVCSKKLQVSGHVLRFCSKTFRSASCLLFSSRRCLQFGKLFDDSDNNEFFENFHMIRHPIRERFHCFFLGEAKKKN